MPGVEPISHLYCPRCGLRVGLHAGRLALDRCPRCFAFDAVSVPMRAVDSTVAPLLTTTESDGDAAILALHGRLDAAADTCLGHALRHAESSGCRRVVIDLRALEFIDWLGLQLLLRAHDDAERSGRELSLRRGPGHVHRLFELTGAAALFVFEP